MIVTTSVQCGVTAGFIKYGRKYGGYLRRSDLRTQLRYAESYGKFGALERDGATKEQFENELAKSLLGLCTGKTLSREQIINHFRTINEFNRQLISQLDSGCMSYEFKQNPRLTQGTRELPQ